jgi:hypothetical protein
MDIGEAFFSSKNEPFKFAAGNLLPYSLAEFRQIDTAIAWSRLCVASFHAAPRPGHVPALGLIFCIPRMLRSA